jgi:Protein of unknown function (DUF995)
VVDSQRVRRSLGAMVIAVWPAAAYATGEADLPDGAEAMPILAARNLFEDKTWEWKEGGAYFGPDRTFKAVVGKGKSLMLAEGRWIVNANAEVCYIAAWRTREQKFRPSKTCYALASKGGLNS